MKFANFGLVKLMILLTFIVVAPFDYTYGALSCAALLLPQKLAPIHLKLLNSVEAYDSFDFETDPITIGLEIEGFTENSHSHESMIAQSARHIKQVIPGTMLDVSEDAINYSQNGHSYTFQIVDEDLEGLGAQFSPAEVVSPILRTPDDLELFYSILSMLRTNMNFSEFPDSGGVHVHVGFPNPQIGEVALLTYIMSLIEDELYSLLKVSDEREFWALKISTEPGYLETILAANSVAQLLDERKLESLGLNLFAIDEHGTIEFKMFNSSVDPNQINLNIDFVKKLVIAVRSKNPKLLDLVIESMQTGEMSVASLTALLEVQIY